MYVSEIVCLKVWSQVTVGEHVDEANCLTFVLSTVVASSFARVLLAHVHRHLGKLFPVVGVQHVGYLFAKVLLLGDALFAHAHVAVVLHRLVMLRMLLVAVVRPTVDTSEHYKLEHRQEEGGGEGRHDPGLKEEKKGESISVCKQDLYSKIRY